VPATTATGAPLRMAFVYVPNGVNLSSWWPKAEGKGFELNRTISRWSGSSSRFRSSPAWIRSSHRRQGRAGRPRAGLRHVPDRPSGQEDLGRRHPCGRLDRPGGGASDRTPHPVPLPGVGLRRRAEIGQLRFRLFLRLPVQPVWSTPTMPWRPSPIPASPSSGSSAPARPANAVRTSGSARSSNDRSWISCSTTRAPCSASWAAPISRNWRNS